MFETIQVMNCESESSFDQIICHSGPHISKTNESNILQCNSDEKREKWKFTKHAST